MIGIGLSIEGDKEAIADLSRFMTVVKQPFLDRALAADLQQEFFCVEKKQFSSKGSFGGTRWPKLSSAYAKRKAKRYPGKPLMRASDKLFKSLTSKKGDTILQTIKRGKGLELGSTISYAIYHQSKAPRKKIPRRALIEHPKKQNIKYLWLVQRSVLRQFKAKAKCWDVGETAIERMLR